MEDKKDPPTVPGLNSISVDELIDAIGDPENIELHQELSNTKHVDVRNFIRATGMVSGDGAVPFTTVYDYYAAWSPHPVGKITFSRYMNQYFKYKKLLGVWCFKINPESVGLPHYYTIYRDRRYSKTAKSTSKYKGVYCVYGYWIARIKLEDNLHYIGNFPTDAEAAQAYDMEAYYHFGDYAKLNFKARKHIYEEEAKKRRREKEKGSKEKETQGSKEEGKEAQVPKTEVPSS